MSTVSGAHRFTEQLARWHADEQNGRGVLAALRRGLGKPPGTAPEMFQYVVRFAPSERRRADWYYVVAALFALHPLPGGNRDLGGCLAQLATRERERQGRDAVSSVDRRFTALLNSHTDDLPDHLRRAVGLLKSAEIPVDWGQMLDDVQLWSAPSRWVQRRWAESYWNPPRPSPSEQPSDATE